MTVPKAGAVSLVVSSPAPMSVFLKKLSRKLLGTQYCASFTDVPGHVLSKLISTDRSRAQDVPNMCRAIGWQTPMKDLIFPVATTVEFGWPVTSPHLELKGSVAVVLSIKIRT